MWSESNQYQRDPICGMVVSNVQAAITYTYWGHTYHFCYQACYDRFARTPTKHVIQLAHAPEGHCGYVCPLQQER
jgi:YHS domain-containing protein